MTKKLDISVVVPLYNEEESLGELVAWIDRVAKANTLSYEVIMVDDGSTDNSWFEVEHLAKMYETELMAIKGIGKAKTQALLTQFKTKEALKSASVEDIAAVMKISFDKAAEVKERFIDEIK